MPDNIVGYSVLDQTDPLGLPPDLDLIESSEPFEWMPTDNVAPAGPLADRWTPWRRWDQYLSRHCDDCGCRGCGCGAGPDRGIGYERVEFAPLVLDTAIGTPHAAWTLQFDRGLQTPDRAEYYWAAPPLGPGGETRLNVIDTVFSSAVGTRTAMATTRLTMRSLDPIDNPNTTGFGDLVLGAKALLIDGRRTQLASIFQTYVPTGVERRGLGTGHTSIEPGVLLRHCFSPKTYLFGELKYWIPLGADPRYAGDVLSTGWGISTIAATSDVFAILPTLEVRTLSFLYGAQTESNDSVTRIDGETAVEVYPGARIVLGPRGDFGLWEAGFSGGLTFADDHWFDTRLVLQLRCAF